MDNKLLMAYHYSEDQPGAVDLPLGNYVLRYAPGLVYPWIVFEKEGRESKLYNDQEIQEMLGVPLGR